MGSINSSCLQSTPSCWMMLRTLLCLSASVLLASYGSPYWDRQQSGFLVSSSTRQEVARKGYSCEPNKYDKNQWCLCRPGERVSEIHSVHDNRVEDRQWTLRCSKIQPEFKVTDKNNWFQETTENKLDGEILWEGAPHDRFLVGMTSDHYNKQEDRKFKFFTTRSDNWFLTDCIWHDKVNKYDGPLDWTLGDDEVIGALYSVHSNSHEDRVWDIQVCKLKEKCTEIVEIQYDTVVSDVSSEKVTAGKQVLDNRKAQNDNSYMAIITQSASESLTESYTFSKTSGFTNKAEMSVTAGAKVGIPQINEYSLAVTVSASSSWNFQETWTRSNSRTYTETNGKQLRFTGNCKKGCLCTMDVIVRTAKGVIPYTMFSRSKDNRHQCMEQGELTVNYAFDGKATVTDEC